MWRRTRPAPSSPSSWSPSCAERWGARPCRPMSKKSWSTLFGVLLVRVAHTPLVAGLRPSTDLDSMNFLAFHFLRADDLAQPEDEDARRVRIRKHRGVPWVLLIEMRQMIQMRLVISVDAVIADRGR